LGVHHCSNKSKTSHSKFSFNSSTTETCKLFIKVKMVNFGGIEESLEVQGEGPKRVLVTTWIGLKTLF